MLIFFISTFFHYFVAVMLSTHSFFSAQLHCFKGERHKAARSIIFIHSYLLKNFGPNRPLSTFSLILLSTHHPSSSSSSYFFCVSTAATTSKFPHLSRFSPFCLLLNLKKLSIYTLKLHFNAFSSSYFSLASLLSDDVNFKMQEKLYFSSFAHFVWSSSGSR